MLSDRTERQRERERDGEMHGLYSTGYSPDDTYDTSTWQEMGSTFKNNILSFLLQFNRGRNILH
jgi:hypothetical protein